MIRQLLTEEEGQTLVEYALLVSLTGLVAIAILTILGQKIRNVFIVTNYHLSTTT